MVVLVHTFDDRAAADHFFSENPDLRDAMARAGVDMDSFRLELLDEVARGRLQRPRARRRSRLTIASKN